MAALLQNNAEWEPSRIFPLNSVHNRNIFVPQVVRDQPCDIALVVNNGREFKAHRHVLKEASPFFEKLLNSDMKEANEGVVRLDVVNENVMSDILEFIYTGNVHISADDNAQELIAIANYMLLLELKTLAVESLEENLTQNLDLFNCIPAYYFAEIFQCEKLLTATKKIILSNFTIVANTEEFLNMSSKEVEMWISSDEIDVIAEKDVFNFILSWIDHDKVKRKKYFAQLFRHVRLVYVSRDFLNSDIVTNDLVVDNEDCLKRVKDALRVIDSGKPIFVQARKSLEIPVLVSSCAGLLTCYLPHEDRWCKQNPVRNCEKNLGLYEKVGSVAACHDKLYLLLKNGEGVIKEYIPYLYCYDSFSNSWTSLTFEDSWRVYTMFAGNGDEIYALMFKDPDRSRFCKDCEDYMSRYVSEGQEAIRSCYKRHMFSITRYNHVSNLWEKLSSFCMVKSECNHVCIVANDNYIYIIGGRGEDREIRLKDAERFHLTNKRWEKISDIQEARWSACGVAIHEKIFVAGCSEQGCFARVERRSCEMYNEFTNEWQFIASLEKPLEFTRRGVPFSPKLLRVDEGLYAVAFNGGSEVLTLSCYDPNRDKWNHTTSRLDGWYVYHSMRVFKGSRCFL